MTILGETPDLATRIWRHRAAPKDRSGDGRPVLLLLTGTISPPVGVPNLKRTNVEQRRHDYVAALRFYLRLPTPLIDRIVFLENSRSDLTDLWQEVERSADDKEVELVSFYGLDFPPQYGRGYGEFSMIDRGFDNSSLLQALAPKDKFWKVTGRLRVLNMQALIRSAPQNYSVLCDVRHWPQRAVDWRVMSCTREGYQRVYQGKYVEFAEDRIGTSGEARDYERLIGRLKELNIVPRHRRQPRIAGVSGEHNVDYYSGVNVLKHWVRVAARAVAPGLWI
jgi:hypothetical protein